MNRRLVNYSVVGSLALLLALPAMAYAQYEAPQGGRLGTGAWGPGGPAHGVLAEMGEQATPRDRGRLGNEQARRGADGAPGFAPSGRGRANRRGIAQSRGRGNFGRSRGGGFGSRGAGRGELSSMATRALAQGDRIGLSAEQRDQILAAQRAVREASITRRAEMQIAELELRDLMSAEAPDVAAVESSLRLLAEHRIAEQTGALRLDGAVTEVLSTEQIDELGDRASNRGRGRADRRAARGTR